jgi:hypothetical protein
VLPVRLAVALPHTLLVPLPLRLPLAVLLGLMLTVAERQSVGEVLGQAELLRERLTEPDVHRVTVGEEEKEGDTDALTEGELLALWLED